MRRWLNLRNEKSLKTSLRLRIGRILIFTLAIFVAHVLALFLFYPSGILGRMIPNPSIVFDLDLGFYLPTVTALCLNTFIFHRYWFNIGKGRFWLALGLACVVTFLSTLTGMTFTFNTYGS